MNEAADLRRCRQHRRRLSQHPRSVPAAAARGPLDDPRCGNDAQALGAFTNGGTYPASSTLENRGVSLVARWDVNDALAFKSITADRRLNWTGTRDADNTPLLILHTNYTSESDQFSQELQALVDTDRIDGVFGLYYFDEDSFDRLLVPLGNPGTSYDTQRVAMDANARAAFTEWTFKFTEAFSATAGVRYTEEDKCLQATMFNVAPATQRSRRHRRRCARLPARRRRRPAACFSRPIASSGSSPRPRRRRACSTASIRAVMTYLSWSEGFKSGGFNQRYNAAPPGNAPISFDPETAESFELGLKFESDRQPAHQCRGVHHRLRRYPDDVSARRRAAVVQCRRCVHRWRGDRARIRADGGFPARCAASATWIRVSTASRRRRPSGRSLPLPRRHSTAGCLLRPEWQGHLGLRTHSSGPVLGAHAACGRELHREQFFDAGNSAEIAQNDDVTLVNASTGVGSRKTGSGASC